ncbi:hypothetical protein C8R43DRAFT_589748 [Mycena crocata]|nr:hypothetical protein C8R43DRAFT_589748 [Mycena crocata]
MISLKVIVAMVPLGIVAFFSDVSSAQTTAPPVTLWQFGTRVRLLPGQFTLPMQPLGTSVDAFGSVTTYRYEVINKVEVPTTNVAGATIETTASAAARTIAASASGWIEIFGPENVLECSFVSENFGQCEDRSATTTFVGNSGAPKQPPPVLQVALPPASSTGPSATFIPISTSSAHHTPPVESKMPVGAIVGSVLAVVAVVVTGLILFILWRRRQRERLRFLEVTENAVAPYDITGAPTNPRSNQSNTNADKTRRVDPNALRTPAQVEAGHNTVSFPLGEKARYDAQLPQPVGSAEGSTSSSGTASPPADLSTTELARLLFHRINNRDTELDTAPPEYPATPAVR